MAVGSLSFTVPAFATAAGFYFFSNHQNKTKDLESPLKNSAEKSKVMSNAKLEKKKKEGDLPRFAVELDGLHCFETVVAH